jgi:drug/metabolite transporter (DMT)-like permease
MNKLITLLVIIINCAVGAFGSIYLKKCASYINKKNKNIIFGFLQSLLKNKNLQIGLALYALAATITVVLLKFNNLNFIYPLTSITYIFTIILSSKLLNEKITKTKWIAITLIIFGNILITI